MKKIISLILCLFMLTGTIGILASCGDDIQIGVQAGTTGEYFVNGDPDWGFEGLDGYAAKGYSNGGLAIADMKSGAVEYVIIDKAPALQLKKAIKGIKVIDIELTEETYAFGVDKAQADLLASINNILATEQDAIKAIIDKYAQGKNLVGVVSAKEDVSNPDKQLVVATNAAFAPFEYKEGEKFYGIDIEIMALVAEKLDLELVIKDMEFDAVVTSVGKNGVDVAAAGLSVNEERAKSVNFSTSYYDAAQVLIVPEDCTDFDSCRTAEDVIAKLDELK
ncbi:MAG: transporter substrate-binding domain-containing protein [Clostridia bacterium]|nr:transporter substrate-binding domain-containing protein [Clostridia bacterium]